MKKFLAVLLVATSVFGLGGCAGRISQPAEVKQGTVITSGKIIAFEGEYVDILTGDLVERYTYDQSQTNDFYLGENVELVSGAKSNQIKSVLEKDFSKRYTTMGELLITTTGVVKDKNDSKFVLENRVDHQTMEIEGNIALPVGTQTTIDYVVQDKKLLLISAYNEETMQTLTVSKITRSESGEMILTLLDGFGKIFESGTANVALHFNLSELKVGDTLSCYHDGIEDGEKAILKTLLLKSSN